MAWRGDWHLDKMAGKDERIFCLDELAIEPDDGVVPVGRCFGGSGRVVFGRGSSSPGSDCLIEPSDA